MPPTATQTDLERLQLRVPLDVQALKRDWIEAWEQALALVESLPPEELGCLYLGPAHTPITPDPASNHFAELQRHRGSVRGTWPTVSPYPSE